MPTNANQPQTGRPQDARDRERDDHGRQQGQRGQRQQAEDEQTAGRPQDDRDPKSPLRSSQQPPKTRGDVDVFDLDETEANDRENMRGEGSEASGRIREKRNQPGQAPRQI